MASKGGLKRQLPPMTVGRFSEASELLERLVAEKRDVFLENANEHRRRHREMTEPRQLSPQEAGQLAAAMVEVIVDGEDPVAFAERLQASGLRAYEEPDPRELLLAAGLSTAPALLDVVKRFVALVEMAPERFKETREAETLDEAIREDAAVLDDVELSEARERAVAALEHVQAATGSSKGKTLGLLTKLVLQAFSQAIVMSQPGTSATESSIASLVNTGGDDSTSSTPLPSDQQ